MTGSSTVSRPQLAQPGHEVGGLLPARVTTTVRPNRGRSSYQRRSSPATDPMTMVAGAATGSFPSRSSVVRR